MVGSYEESILRGRMSTTPSKPLEFMAQIGVLGMGECSARLKCPPHVTLPFAAVYYSYGSTSHGRSQSDDGPSPYVGQVDLENGLPNQEGEGRSRRKAQSRYRAAEDQNNGEPKNATREATPRNSSSRSSGGPRAPPGGSYRIPAKGQLQIIIKNQNKTAVKLFLVPYDLAGMEPGTKTFMRQRCYSAGPILDGIPRTSAAAAAADEKPTLRYLIHLHICCPSRGRYYLYKSIRVVFANRVPDGKERLRNEMTMPDPRYTPYKPVRVMQPLATPSAVSGAALAADKALRRRSAGFPPYTPSRPSAGLESSALAPHSTDRRYFSSAAGAAPSDYHHTLLVADPILLHLPTSKRNGSVASGDDSPSTSRPSTVDSSTVPDLGGAGNLDGYAKLSRGDAGYGGLPFTQLSTDAAASEGLLTQRLRSIGVAGDSPPRDAAHPSI